MMKTIFFSNACDSNHTLAPYQTFNSLSSGLSVVLLDGPKSQHHRRIFNRKYREHWGQVKQ